MHKILLHSICPSKAKYILVINYESLKIFLSFDCSSIQLLGAYEFKYNEKKEENDKISQDVEDDFINFTHAKK